MADVISVLPTLPQIVDEKGSEAVQADGENVTEDFTNLTGRKKRLAELQLKMNEARKAYQTSRVAEKKRMEDPWIEERKKKIGKLLCVNGLDITKCKKWEKYPAPFGWDVVNQKTLSNAYKKRANNVEVGLEG